MRGVAKKDIFYPNLNFGLLDESDSSFEKSRFVVLPVPYDGTTSYKSGTREGPGAIIEASQYVEPYDREMDLELGTLGIHTLPEMIPVMKSAQGMVDRIHTATEELVKKGKTVVMLGGDHSVSIGAIKAHVQAYPGLSVLQFDAHPDLRDEYEESKLSSATVMRRASELGAGIVQVGIRALTRDEIQFAQEKGIQQFFAEDIIGRKDWMDQVVESLADHVYVSFDLDYFDSSIMAATGTPEPGGLDWYSAVELLRKVARSKKVVGVDVVELSPFLGSHSCSFLAAKLTYKLMAYMATGKA